MIETTNINLDTAELRELTLEEIEATSGAGILRWLKCLFGGCDAPQPARGPFNQPTVK